MSDYIVPEGVTVLTSDILDEYRGVSSIILPEGVTEIASRAFKYCTSLTSITLPKSLRKIGYEAFDGCKNLSEVHISDLVAWCNVEISYGLTSSPLCYGGSLYLNGKIVKNLVIPEGVTEIASCAFKYCTSLTSITLPKSLRRIRCEAFYKCKNLSEVHISDIAAWCDIQFGDDDSNPLNYTSRLYLNGELVTTLVFPERVTKITLVNFKYSKCNITSLILPEGVTEIASEAFSYCQSLTSITLPKSLRKIGKDAFEGCKKLSEVHISDIAAWCSIEFNSNPLYCAENLYLNGELVENLIIPEGVTEIASDAFYGCKSLTSITLPKSLRKIGRVAFYGCKNLSEVHISDITDWWNIEFNGDESNPLKYAKNLYVNGELVENLVISEGVTEIASEAFSYCQSLTSITLPKSLCRIQREAFDGCKNLSEVHISDIAIWCEIEFHSAPLKYAKKLYVNGKLVKKLVIPEGVTEISAYAFQDYTNLTSITLPKSLREIRESAFAGCTGLTEIIIPEGVIEIASKAFRNCESLTSITLPKSLREIGESAFDECENLSEVHISDVDALCNSFHNTTPFPYAKNLYLNGKLLTELAVSQAHDFNFLTSVVIPEGVTEITATAFCDCESLTSITFPKSLRKIVCDYYSGDITVVLSCRNLSKVYISDIAAWCEIEYDRSEVEYDNYRYRTSYYPQFEPNPFCPNIHDLYLNGELLTDLVVPEGVIEIREHAFKKCASLTSIITPKSVTKIEACAFSDCKSLTSVLILEGVTKIGSHAFAGCTSLTSVVIPEGVTEIEDHAFAGCPSLTSIVIPKSVTRIGDAVFFGCTSLTSIVLPNGILNGYSSIRNLFKGCKNLKHAVAPMGMHCSTLTSIVIPEGVITIGEEAFSDCTSLTSIVIPKSVTTIFERGFKDCKNKPKIQISDLAAWCKIKHIKSTLSQFETSENLYLNGELVTTLVIPEGVTEIASRAFYGCKSLTSITLPKSLRKIGESAFYGCKNLSEVHISDITAWCEIEFEGYCSNPLEYAKSLYLNGELLTYLAIPDDITTIKRDSFAGCSSLASIVIPEGVTEISAYAFQDCTSLTSIIIPKTVTELGEAAFADCTSLTSIIIPKTVTELGDSAFKGCSSLASIVIPDGVTRIGDAAFKGCSSLASIVIPEGVTEIGEYAFADCTSLTSIVIPKSITTILNGAFLKCTSLSEVYIFDLTAWFKIEFKKNKWGPNLLSNPLNCAKNIYLNGELLTDLVIPNDITEIKFGHFSGNTSLTSIVIPESVIEIGDAAFEGCSSLTSIILPESVTKIGEYAFKGCSHLEKVQFPKGLKLVGHSAFEECTQLKHLLFPQVTYSDTFIPPALCIGAEAFQYCTSLQFANIYNVGAIGHHAFYGCTSLRAISIFWAYGIYISQWAFCKCDQLTSVTLLSMERVSPLMEKIYLIRDYYQRFAFLSEDFGDYQAHAYYNTGEDCSFGPWSNPPCSEIREYAFCGCVHLSSLILDGDPTMDTEQIPHTKIDTYAFSGCLSLNHLTFPYASENQFIIINEKPLS